jgi:hypothetical protein
MKRKFKVEATYEGSSIYYAVYQKRRFFLGWKFITKFVYKEAALRMAKELSEPPTYIE